jgi:hypothetical protein
MKFPSLALAAVLAACQASVADDHPASASTATHVDRIVPRDTALAQFRAGLAPVSELGGGRASKEALLDASVRALEGRDTLELARLAITRAEFAWLYYPTTPQAMPPYDVEPALLWFLQRSRSDRAVRRALEAYGGEHRQVLGWDCAPSARQEGENRVWGPCAVRWKLPGGDTVSVRLVGQLIERNGRFKILSYSNTL